MVEYQNITKETKNKNMMLLGRDIQLQNENEVFEISGAGEMGLWLELDWGTGKGRKRNTSMGRYYLVEIVV